MTVIISKNGKNAKKVETTSFDLENNLQQYIYDNPESIPVYEIREDIRLLIVAREFPTNSGPIDALGVDQEGMIYIIETKLYKNSDKRLVMAQVLDYGASMWRHATNFDDFTSTLESKVQQQFGMSLLDKLKEFFIFDEETATPLLQNIRDNLSGGHFKFVILMDKLEDRLKDLIVYINQNSQFDVYAVELEYYKHEDFEIIIPKLYGAEVKKEVTGAKNSQHVLTLEEFWNALSDSFSDLQFKTLKSIIESLMEKASEVKMGTKSIGLIFNHIGDKSLFAFYTRGWLSLNFGHISQQEKKVLLQSLCQKYIPKVWKNSKFQKNNLFDTYPGLSSDEVIENIDQIQKIFDEFLR